MLAQKKNITFLTSDPLFQVHHGYNPADFRNDVALVRLAKDVVFKEHIIPVCLPSYDQDFVGQYAKVLSLIHI